MNGIDLEKTKERVRNAKAFLFDFDGTLVNLDMLNVDGFKIVFKDMFNLEFSKEDFMKYISGKGAKNGIQQYLELKGIKDFSSQEVYKRFHIEKKRLIDEELEKEVYLLPGIGEFLKYYSEKKIIVVTSSKEEFVKRVLTHFNIYSYFEKVFDRNSVVRGKPNPDMYIKGIEYVNTPASECIAFEDSFYGLQSSKGADLFTVGILNPTWNDDFVYHLSDYVIQDYTELITPS